MNDDNVAELYSEVPAWIPLAGTYDNGYRDHPTKAIEECSAAEIMRFIEAIIVKERELRDERESLIRYVQLGSHPETVGPCTQFGAKHFEEEK